MRKLAEIRFEGDWHMRKFSLLGIVAATALAGCVVQQPGGGGSGGGGYAYCGGDHRLNITDLDMTPDPVAQGERVRMWRVRVRSDASGECQTTLRIRERSDGDIVGRARVYYLRPGVNTIEFDPLESYRFKRREHCFDVIADIGGTSRPVDAARAFCARQTGGNRWSLR
jgi:hypothetical protein